MDWVAEMDKCRTVQYRDIPIETHYDVANREWSELCQKLIDANADLHTCPDCGENCKGCQCYEAREADYCDRIAELVQEVEEQRVKDKHEKPGTIKNNDCPLVMIEWVDSAQPQSRWQFLEDLEAPDAINCVSVGWLVADGKTNKSVAPNMGNINSPDSMQVSGVITIPVRSIVKITIL